MAPQPVRPPDRGRIAAASSSVSVGCVPASSLTPLELVFGARPIPGGEDWHRACGWSQTLPPWAPAPSETIQTTAENSDHESKRGSSALRSFVHPKRSCGNEQIFHGAHRNAPLVQGQWRRTRSRCPIVFDDLTVLQGDPPSGARRLATSVAWVTMMIRATVSV